LEEADRLCARISLVDAGRVIAEGTPAALKSRVGQSRVEVTVPERWDVTTTAATIARALDAVAQVDPATRRVAVPVRDGEADPRPARPRGRPCRPPDRGHRTAPPRPRRGLPAPDRDRTNGRTIPMSTTHPTAVSRAAWATLDTWVVARRHLLRLTRRPDELLGTLLI